MILIGTLTHPHLLKAAACLVMAAFIVYSSQGKPSHQQPAYATHNSKTIG